MNKLIITLATVILLAGCGHHTRTVDEIDIVKNVRPIEVLHPPLPEGVTWEEVEIIVLTPEIMRELLTKLDNGEINEGDVVFAALTSDGYEHLAVNLAELKRYIEDQKAVIMYYRDNIPDKVFAPREDGQ